jgi:hypothetical protein
VVKSSDQNGRFRLESESVRKSKFPELARARSRENPINPLDLPILTAIRRRLPNDHSNGSLTNGRGNGQPGDPYDDVDHLGGVLTVGLLGAALKVEWLRTSCSV